MHPADKGGGAGDGVDDGVGGAGGGDGVPEMWATVSDDPISPFGGYINLLLSNGDGAGTMPSGSIGGGAPATMPTDLEVLRRTSGLEFFEEVQLGDIWSTPSVNQPASVPIHGLDGQVDDFLDEGCGDDVVDNESDHYDELLVRCEGDTDVEELYPTRAEAVVQDVMSKAEMMKEARVKKAKHKAEKSRAAKRRALEGDVEEEGMTFGDQVSDDCKELTDSSDDDQVVDGNDISLITKKRNRSKKAFKRAYYDESRLNAHDQFQINMCFEDVHQFRRALLNYHVVHQRDWEFLRNDKDRITVCCKSEGPCPFVVMTSTLSGETTHAIRQLILPHTCGKVYTSSRINSVWLSKTYEDQ